MWYVYIVECNDKNKTLYTGITNDIISRIEKHNNGLGAKYTRGRTPVLLKRTFEVKTKSEALKLEYKIKHLPKEDKLKFQQKDII